MQAKQRTGRRRVLQRYSAENREQLIKEQGAQSGLTKKAFCEQQGVSLGTFQGWMTRRRAAVAGKPAFAEVSVCPRLEVSVEVLLPNGARIGIRHEGKREDLVALIRELQAQNQVLTRKVQLLLQRLFGRKSEKIDPAQLEMLLGGLSRNPADDEEDPPPDPPPSRPRRNNRKRKPRLPEDLPTEDIVVDPEAVKQNPSDYLCIGEEITEELDVTPTRYFRRRIIRRKFKSKINRSAASDRASGAPDH